MKISRPRWHCLGVKPQFVSKIVSGEKTTTIRVSAPNMKAGNVINFFTGRRTKDCKYAISAIILDVFDVHISRDMVVLNGNRLSEAQSLQSFAENDGFNSFGEMIAFFEKMYGKKAFPFTGKLILFNEPFQNLQKTE